MKKSTVERRSSIKNGFHRLGVAMLSLLLDFFLLVWITHTLQDRGTWITVGIGIVSAILVVAIYSQQKTSAMKMPWIVLILAVPVFGILLYLMIGLSGSTRNMKKRYSQVDDEILPLLPENLDIREKIREKDLGEGNISTYLSRFAKYPPYENTEVKFFSDTSYVMESLKEDLQKAQKFIFMEYHAVEEREAFGELKDILIERAAAGVEVRIFYDDFGSISFINSDFITRMAKYGIHCRAFNPVSPLINFFLNNRDHRKLIIIDGIIGHTGGYNMADEYFNYTSPYGYWKDTGIRLVGDAVNSMTITFLEQWNAARRKDRDETDQIDAANYIAERVQMENSTGFVQPYADNPMDKEPVGENVYLSMIENAKEYCYFTSPYLILTDEMIRVLGLAAKRGVDVRIITPGIPDKKLVYNVTRSYYRNLLRCGVRIYEYTPGFLHSKQCICDGKLASCGTVNLDFRSFYHHFENGCLLYGCDAIKDMRADFEKLFMDSREISDQYVSMAPVIVRIEQAVMRLVAGLL